MCFRYKGKWSFSLLHQTINEEMTVAERKVFFDETLPGIVRLALSLPTLVTVVSHYYIYLVSYRIKCDNKLWYDWMIN